MKIDQIFCDNTKLSVSWHHNFAVLQCKCIIAMISAVTIENFQEIFRFSHGVRGDITGTPVNVFYASSRLTIFLNNASNIVWCVPACSMEAILVINFIICLTKINVSLKVIHFSLNLNNLNCLLSFVCHSLFARSQYCDHRRLRRDFVWFVPSPWWVGSAIWRLESAWYRNHAFISGTCTRNINNATRNRWRKWNKKSAAPFATHKETRGTQNEGIPSFQPSASVS